MTTNDFLNVSLDESSNGPPKYSLHKFYNANKELVYVSKKPNFSLIMRHNWWWSVTDIKITHYRTAGEQEDAKCRAINNEGAKFNLHGRIT
jgi:hypothetical protein